MKTFDIWMSEKWPAEMVLRPKCQPMSTLKCDLVSDCSRRQVTLEKPCCRFSGKGWPWGRGERGAKACLEKSAVAGGEKGETGWNTPCPSKCQLAFNLKLQGWRCGGPCILRGGQGGSTMLLLPWESGSSLLVTFSYKYLRRNLVKPHWVVTFDLFSGGYCTGDNYRDERPIDVFVLNTSNYRWTEVV